MLTILNCFVNLTLRITEIMNNIYSDEVFAYPGGVRFSNGLVLNWGTAGVGQVNTFPVPYTTTNYSVGCCMDDNSEHNINNTIRDKTTTSFTFGRGYHSTWIAIGY